MNENVETMETVEVATPEPTSYEVAPVESYSGDVVDTHGNKLRDVAAPMAVGGLIVGAGLLLWKKGIKPLATKGLDALYGLAHKNDPEEELTDETEEEEKEETKKSTADQNKKKK